MKQFKIIFSGNGIPNVEYIVYSELCHEALIHVLNNDDIKSLKFNGYVNIECKEIK